MAETKFFSADETLVNQLITGQHSSIRFHLIFAAGIFFLGIVIIVVCLVFMGNLLADAVKALIGVGSGFIASLSTLQLKEILQCRSKIGVFENMKIRLQSLSEGRSGSDPEEQEKMKELLWKIIEKTATG